VIQDVQPEPELVAMIRQISGGRTPIGLSTAIYHDLQIAGDDAFDLIARIRDRYGVSFSAMDFQRYFPPEGEALFCYLASKFGYRDKRRPRLTVEHLLSVIERGSWFDPQP